MARHSYPGQRRRGHEPVVKLLLERGAEVESKDKEGQTPFSGALQRVAGEWQGAAASRETCIRTTRPRPALMSHQR
jgi:hypothetical protein